MKNIMPSLVMCSILLLVFGPSAHAQSRLYTLDELQATATEHYEALRIMNLAINQADLQRKEASAQRLPKLDFDASYTWVSETASIEFAIPGVFSREMTLGDGNIYSTGITLSAPLFTGFRLQTTVEMREEAQRIARQTLEGTAMEVRNAVARSYLAALLAAKNASVLLTQEQGLTTTLGIAKSLVAQQQAIPYDTLVVSTRVSQLRVARANALHQELKAKLMLEQLTGIRQPFELEEHPSLSLPDATKQPERLVTEASSNRYEGKNYDSQKRIAALAEKMQRGSYYPTVSAFAGYKYGKPGIDQFANAWMDYATAGIALQWNIFSWGADSRKVQEQKIEQEKIDLQKQLWLSGLRTNIETSLNEIDLAQQTMHLVQEQIRQEQDKNAIVQARFRQGLATATDVVDAEVSLTAAKLKYEQSHIEYYIHLNELAGLLGKDM